MNLNIAGHMVERRTPNLESQASNLQPSNLPLSNLEPSNLQPSTLPRDASLTITRADVAPEDVAAAEIPDAAFTRGDDIGKLIGAAFNLPPPPVPSFALD